MSNVVDIRKKDYEELAKDFVRIYLQDGEQAAGKFTCEHLTEDEYVKLKPYVEAEFEAIGMPLEEINLDE